MKKLLDYIFKENPIMVLAVGLCPAMAITTTVKDSHAMGIAVTFVLVASSLIISLIRNFIDPSIKKITVITIIAALSGVVEMFMKAFFSAEASNLGIYLSMIAVNLVIYEFVNSVSLNQGRVASFFASIGTGIGFMIILFVVGLIREVLGNGTIYGVAIPVLCDHHVSTLLTPPGGFVVLAVVLAIFSNFRKEDEENA